MVDNPDTRIIICCYQGDMHQLYMPAYTQHGCPVTVLSPDDSRAEIPGVDCQFGGKRAYIGQDSLDRQRIHLQMMLSFPENHFMIHDSDSVLLDAKIPDYLYAEPDVVWSNQVFDNINEHQETLNQYGWDRIALQPPYFLSRKTIEAMLAVADDPRCKATAVMPFIDYYMVQLTMVAGLPWRRFENCLSCPVAGDPLKEAARSSRDRATYRNGRIIADSAIAQGAMIVHSVKDPHAVRELMIARQKFLGVTVVEPPATMTAHERQMQRRRAAAGQRA